MICQKCLEQIRDCECTPEPMTVNTERRVKAGSDSRPAHGWALAWLGVGLAIGNFVYQLCGPEQWGAAVERTWFQVVALFAAWVVGRLFRPRPNSVLNEQEARNGG